MQFLNLLGLVAGLLTATEAITLNSAGPRNFLSEHSLARLQAAQPPKTPFKNMIISDIVTRSVVDPKNSSVFDDSIHFIFTDPNSNTSTACNDDFQGSASNTTFPTGWVPCNNNGNLMDDFYWQFISYNNLTSFKIELIHAFLNFANSGTLLRSEAKNITLHCADVAHQDGCYSNKTITLKVESAGA